MLEAQGHLIPSSDLLALPTPVLQDGQSEVAALPRCSEACVGGGGRLPGSFLAAPTPEGCSV